MDTLATIPNLMDLVRNPFLLTLALEALPSVVEGRTDLSRLRVTRVELYKTFVKHWLNVNKRRLQDQALKDDKLEVLEELLADGFEQNGIVFQKTLRRPSFESRTDDPLLSTPIKGRKHRGRDCSSILSRAPLFCVRQVY